ncbi:MAG TPA: hypothetical protein PKO06_21310, partial [Candidatus Ozemobacteraceae bacterium]|nr:hypothetical protein [Candidatus Ozemobacteraceae bacterium]
MDHQLDARDPSFAERKDLRFFNLLQGVAADALESLWLFNTADEEFEVANETISGLRGGTEDDSLERGGVFSGKCQNN